MKKILSILAVLSLSVTSFAVLVVSNTDNNVFAQDDEDDVEIDEEKSEREVKKDDDKESDNDDESEKNDEDEEEVEEVDPELGQKLFAAFTQHAATESYLFDITGLEEYMTPVVDSQYQVEMPQFYPNQYLVKTNEFDNFADVPEGMEFYLVKPNKINEQVVYGFNDERAIVFVNPPFIPLYTSMISNGVELEAETLLLDNNELSQDALDRIVISPTNFETENLTNEHFAKVWKLVKGEKVNEDEVFEVRRDVQYVNPDLRNNTYIYPVNTFEIRATVSQENLVFTIQPDGGIMVYPNVPYLVVGSDIDTVDATRGLLEGYEMYHVSDVADFEVDDIVEQFE